MNQQDVQLPARERFFQFSTFCRFRRRRFFLHSSLLISLKALPTAFRSTFALFPFWHFVLWNLFHICIIVRSCPMSTSSQYFFVIFNIFTISISCFCAICILFFMKPTHIFFLLPFFCSTHFAVPCVFLFHMFHFSVFHYFFDNCNCFNSDFIFFCSVFLSFCRI